MAEYYIEMKKIFPLNNKEKAFIGPFDRKNEAMNALEKMRDKVKYEIVTNPDTIPQSQESVMVAFVSRTAAIRAGMKNSREAIPLKLDDLTKKENGVSIHSETPPQQVRRKYTDIPLIVSKYKSTIGWLQYKGVDGEIVDRPSPNLVKDRVVYGQLPYRLAALAREVRIVDLPRLPFNSGEKILTFQELEDAGANIQEFKIVRLTAEWRKIFDYLEKPENFDYILELSI